MPGSTTQRTIQSTFQSTSDVTIETIFPGIDKPSLRLCLNDFHLHRSTPASPSLHQLCPLLTFTICCRTQAYWHSAAPLSRGFGNVTCEYVFCYGPFTLAETQYKYKLFSTHRETHTLFCNACLLRVAEWSIVEWRGLDWSRGHCWRGSETLRKPLFRSLGTNFIVKQPHFDVF